MDIGTYTPTAKGQEFHRDPAKFRLLLGAWGSGKTTIMTWEDILQAIEFPGSIGVVYRRTYPALRDTTQRQYVAACPTELIKRRIRTEGREEIEFFNGSRTLFRCLDDPIKLGSSQFDRVNLDEAEEVDEEYFTTLAYGRLRGTVGPRRMVLATNPPDKSHWLYKTFVKEKQDDMSVHHFTTYDNAQHLPPGYIAKLETMNPTWKRKYLYGQWGILMKGTPVYSGFREDLHVAPLVAQRARPLVRGWDFGFRHPACLWGQVTVTGHFNILHELVGEGEELVSFATKVVNETAHHFPWAKDLTDYGDISGTQKNDRGPTVRKVLWDRFKIALLGRKYGLNRTIEHVQHLLDTLVNGTPLLRLNAHCTETANALAGGYARDDEGEPKKDGYYDDIADALRYCVVPETINTAEPPGASGPLPRWRFAV